MCRQAAEKLFILHFTLSLDLGAPEVICLQCMNKYDMIISEVAS